MPELQNIDKLRQEEENERLVVYLPMCIYLLFPPWLPAWLSALLPAWLPGCLLAGQSLAGLQACPRAGLPTKQPTVLPTSPPALVCLPARKLGRLAGLRTCQPVCLPAFQLDGQAGLPAGWLAGQPAN